jgi:hypothetical protein
MMVPREAPPEFIDVLTALDHPAPAGDLVQLSLPAEIDPMMANLYLESET